MLENLIPRIHLFEWEDQKFFPANIRGYMQDFLHFTQRMARPLFEPYAAKLAEVMKQQGEKNIIDLCSGSGGPIEGIVYWMEKKGYPVTVQVTDFFPNVEAFRGMEARNPRIEGITQSVDVMNVPANLKGFRLVCNGLHHFSPPSAHNIIANAVKSGQGIAVLEMVSRNLLGVVQVFFGFLSMLILTPFIPPFRWGRLFWTYIIPVVPLATLWDGLVSCLRVYSPRDLRRLVSDLEGKGYVFDIGAMAPGKGPGKITYLFAYRPLTSI